MPPAARIGDMHTCPMFDGPKPHVGGPILPPCAVTVFTGGIPQARVSDMATCVGPPDVIAKGSAGVMVMGLPAARMGDLTAHGGVIIVGLPTVMIGEVGGGGAGGGGGGMGMPMQLEGAAGDPVQMARTMIEAARQGQPFTEQCTQGG